MGSRRGRRRPAGRWYGGRAGALAADARRAARAASRAARAGALAGRGPRSAPAAPHAAPPARAAGGAPPRRGPRGAWPRIPRTPGRPSSASRRSSASRVVPGAGWERRRGSARSSSRSCAWTRAAAGRLRLRNARTAIAAIPPSASSAIATGTSQSEDEDGVEVAGALRRSVRSPPEDGRDRFAGGRNRSPMRFEPRRLGLRGSGGRRGVEWHPADVVEVRLDPGVRVEVPHDVGAGARRRSGAESGCDPGRDADHPQHQRHGPGELLAITDPVAQQERPQGQLPPRRDLAVRVAGAKIGLDPPNGVVGGPGAGRDVPGEPVDPGIRGMSEGQVRAPGSRSSPEGHRELTQGHPGWKSSRSPSPGAPGVGARARKDDFGVGGESPGVVAGSEAHLHRRSDPGCRPGSRTSRRRRGDRWTGGPGRPESAPRRRGPLRPRGFPPPTTSWLLSPRIVKLRVWIQLGFRRTVCGLNGEPVGLRGSSTAPFPLAVVSSQR